MVSGGGAGGEGHFYVVYPGGSMGQLFGQVICDIKMNVVTCMRKVGVT